jgi:predicted nucleic acid-binding protein
MDAIHLATAQQMDVAEFHTYCERLHKWSGALGFSVTEPQTAQGLLGTDQDA